MLNFKRPTREKSYLRGSKNMPLNSAVAVFRGGGFPGRILRYISMSASWGVFKASRRKVWLITTPVSSRSGKKTWISVRPASPEWSSGRGGKLVVRLEHHFPGRRIHNVSGSEDAFQILAHDFDLVMRAF